MAGEGDGEGHYEVAEESRELIRLLEEAVAEVLACVMHYAFKTLNYTRGLPAEAATNQIFKEDVTSKGSRDDTTCIVVNILPPEKLSPPLKTPGIGVIKALPCWRPSDEMSEDEMDRGCLERNVMEEIYEGSAMLAERKYVQAA